MHGIIIKTYEDKILDTLIFSSYIKAYEYIEKIRQEKKDNFYIHNNKRDKYGKLVYISFRHSSNKKFYYSYKIIKLSNNINVNKALLSKNLFGGLHKNRIKSLTLRFSEKEIQKLQDKAAFYNITITDLVRIVLRNSQCL